MTVAQQAAKLRLIIETARDGLGKRLNEIIIAPTSLQDTAPIEIHRGDNIRRL